MRFKTRFKVLDSPNILNWYLWPRNSLLSIAAEVQVGEDK